MSTSILDRDRAARPRERRHDALGGAVTGDTGVDRQPVVGAGNHRRAGDAGQLILELIDFSLDLAAVHAFAAGRHQLRLDLVDHLDGRLDAGVSRVDGGGAETQGVLHRAESLVVRTHRRRDRPVSCVVRRVVDAVAGGDAVLRFRQRLVRLRQRLQRGHRRNVRIDATHGVCPSVSLGDVLQNVGHTGSPPAQQSGVMPLGPPTPSGPNLLWGNV